MARPPRIESQGRWFHILNRGAARQDIFFTVQDRVEFEELLGIASDRFGVRVHAFCLMSNHYHLLLECPSGGLSEAMHVVGSRYVRRFNKRQGRDGPLFRDRFYAKPVASDAYLMRLVRYIHRNPLAFCSIEQLRDYRWSSFRMFLGHRKPPAWMATDHVLGMFDGPEDLAQYVMQSDSESNSPLEGGEWLAAIDLMVEECFGDRVGGRASKAAAMLLLDRLDGADRSTLAAALAFPSAAAERTARSRAHRLAEEIPELRAVVQRVIDIAA